jgi:hypothetical protein
LPEDAVFPENPPTILMFVNHAKSRLGKLNGNIGRTDFEK